MMQSHGDCISKEVSKKSYKIGYTLYFLNSSKTINFGENVLKKRYSLQNTKFNSIYSNPFFQLLKPVQIPSEFIKILWQFFCSHVIITDLTIPRKLSDNLALETTKWDKSFKMKTNKCYRSILQKYIYTYLQNSTFVSQSLNSSCHLCLQGTCKYIALQSSEEHR